MSEFISEGFFFLKDFFDFVLQIFFEDGYYFHVIPKSVNFTVSLIDGILNTIIMKKTIFYQMKIAHEFCKIFCSSIYLIFSNFNLTEIFKHKKHQFYLIVFFMLSAFHSNLYSQAVSGAAVQANFGIDADVYANKEQFLVPPTTSGLYDDWFYSAAFATGTGENVIDQTNAASLKTSIQANNNFTFEKRMSKPKNTTVGNFLWIDAVYGRDGNSTQSNNDSNVFSGNSNKNGDNPATWALGVGSIPQKDDIVDVYGYLKRDVSPLALATNPNGILWGYGGASKISSDGNSHFDFEFFRTEVSYNGSNWKNSRSGRYNSCYRF